MVTMEEMHNVGQGKRKEYRYRDPRGSTHFSLIAVQRHLAKVGELQYIKGYVDDRKGYTQVFVLVRGVNGTARFKGFGWGFKGEGPRGLEKLLIECNVPEATRKAVLEVAWEPTRIHESASLPKGVCWFVSFVQKRFWLETENLSASGPMV